MPLNELIPLMAGRGVTPLQSPLQTLGQVYQLREMQQNYQTDQLQLEAAQRQEQERQDLGAIYRRNLVIDPRTGRTTLDMPAALSAAYRTNPQLAYGQEQQYRKHQAETRTSDLEARKAELEQAASRLEFGGQIAQGVEARIAAGGDPQQAWQWGIQSMRAAGFPIQGIPEYYDQATLAGWKGQAASIKDRLQAEQKVIEQQLREREVRVQESQIPLNRARARREGKEVEALEGVQAVEPGGKRMSEADIADAMKQTGRSRPEIIEAAKARGYRLPSETGAAPAASAPTAAPMAATAPAPAPVPAPAAATPAAPSPRLQADEQRLRALEATREREEQHIERLRPYATSEAGAKRLTEAHRQMDALTRQIDTLRDRLYEQGPESLTRKQAVAQAGVEAALDKPLSSEDAALYGVPGGTTARELREQVSRTPAPLKGEAAKAYQMGSRMNRGHETVSALEAAGVTGTPFLNTLEQTVDKLTGAIGAVVGVATGGGLGGAGAGAGVGLGVGGLASPLVNQLRTPEQRRYVTAQLAFIAGILRKESGAAITAEEYKQYARIFFPQSGDDADTIAAKRALRQEEIASLQEQFPNRPFPGAPTAATRVRAREERAPGILQPRPSERPQPGQRGWPYTPGGSILD